MQTFWVLCAVLQLSLGGVKPDTGPDPARPEPRVIRVELPGATQAFVPRAEAVSRMLEQGIAALAETATASDFWKQRLSPQDVVGIKVHTAPGPHSGTRAVVVEALVEQLLRAGVDASRILIWDKRREWLVEAGMLEVARRRGVQLAASGEAGWDDQVFYESSILGTPVHGEHEFGKKGEGVGRNSYVSRLVTRRITKIIQVTPLLNHNEMGVSGLLQSLALGSVDNTRRFESHRDRLAVAVPEIYNLPELADRVVLNVVDALVAQYHGETRTLLHYARALDQLWFSQDPVALDVLALQELQRLREALDVRVRARSFELYANAALLELGEADLKKIRLQHLLLPAGPE